MLFCSLALAAISVPRSRCHISSPLTLPQASRSSLADSDSRRSMVKISLSFRRASILAPMPGRSRSGSRSNAAGRSQGRMTVKPSGLFMSAAILAR